jgi:hypothetical protein
VIESLQIRYLALAANTGRVLPGTAPENSGFLDAFNDFTPHH